MGLYMTYRWREGVVLVHGLHAGVGHLGDGRVLEEVKSRGVYMNDQTVGPQHAKDVTNIIFMKG